MALGSPTQSITTDEISTLKTFAAADLAAAIRERCSVIEEGVLRRVEHEVAICDPICAAALSRISPPLRCFAILLSLVLAEAGFELMVRSKPSRRAKFRATCDDLGISYDLVAQLSASETTIAGVVISGRAGVVEGGRS